MNTWFQMVNSNQFQNRTVTIPTYEEFIVNQNEKFERLTTHIPTNVFGVIFILLNRQNAIPYGTLFYN